MDPKTRSRLRKSLRQFQILLEDEYDEKKMTGYEYRELVDLCHMVNIALG